MISFVSRFVVAPKQFITLPPLVTVACPAAPSLAPDAPIIEAPTGFEASRLPYSMAYGGTLIPSNTDDVVGGGSVAITPDRYASSIQSCDDSPCGYGKARRYPLSQFLFDCCTGTKSPQLCVGTLVPSAFNPRDNSPLIGLRQAGPTT